MIYLLCKSRVVAICLKYYAPREGASQRIEILVARVGESRHKYLMGEKCTFNVLTIETRNLLI